MLDEMVRRLLPRNMRNAMQDQALFTLAFLDRKRERDFLNYFIVSSLLYARVTLIVGTFFIAVSGFWTEWFIPINTDTWFLIRFTWTIPVAILLFALTFKKEMSSFQLQLISSAYAQVLLSSIIAIWVVTPVDYVNDYGFSAIEIFQSYGFPSFMLVCVFQTILMRMRFVSTVINYFIGVSTFVTVSFVLAPPLGWFVNDMFMLTNAVSLGMLCAYLLEYYIRKSWSSGQLVELERQKSEKLLLNILPEAIAHRLKHADESIADGFSNVSVIFADIAGFTPLSETMPPRELVGVLNDVFSQFDHLVDKLGLEKIKTIGDAYMAAGGIPLPTEQHAHKVAELGLGMIDIVRSIELKGSDRPLEIRIGINSGPVVAGVIGIKKFIYDLWGDTVNTAARMESHGEVGRIQVTESTFDLLKNDFIFEERGLVDIKGKNKIKTWWLVRPSEDTTVKK